MEKNTPELLSLDRTFRTELSFFAQAGTMLDEKVRADCMKALPFGVERRSTINQSLANMSELQKGSAYKLCSGIVRDEVASLVDILQKLQRNVSPKLDMAASTDTFMQGVFKHLPYFASHVLTNDGSEVTLWGRDAIAHMFSNMRARFSADASLITIGDLEVFQGFKWLLTPEEQGELSDWVSRVLRLNLADGGAKGGDGGDNDATAEHRDVVDVSAASSNAATSKRGGKKKDERDTSAANIMKFFSRG